MPVGVVDYQTTAANASPEGQVEVLTFSTGTLLEGDNVLAVEVHQSSANSSDVVFGMNLAAVIEPNLVHKITVDNADTDTTKQLAARGAFNLADYGSFSLWSVTANQATGLVNRASVAVRYDFDAIAIRGGLQINNQTGEPGIPPNLAQIRTDAPQLWMAQFAGPVQDAWLETLAGLGLERVTYEPANAYVVWGDRKSLDALDGLVGQLPFLAGTHAFHPYYRLESSLQRAVAQLPPTQMVDVSVEVFRSPAVEQTLAKLRALGGKVRLEPGTVEKLTSLSLQVPVGRLVEVANWNDVYNVEPWIAPIRMDEVQGHILAGNLKSSGGNIVPLATSDLTYLPYRNWLLSKGFPTAPANYPVVDVVDDGIDQGNAAAVLHPDFFKFGNVANPSRILYIGNCTADASGNGVGGHGNLNAGIVGAYNNRVGAPFVDANGYHIGQGVSPFGRLGGTKIFRNPAGGGSFDISGCGGTLQGLVGSSYANGANLTSQSWGAPVGGAYDVQARAYDSLTRDASTTAAGLQQMLHVFAAGNSGPGASTIGSPGTAKNVLTVGATENVRDEGIGDGCVNPMFPLGVRDANNADDVISFSSRGPTTDGRKKPDIMAPGTHVQGPASQDPGFAAPAFAEPLVMTSLRPARTPIIRLAASPFTLGLPAPAMPPQAWPGRRRWPTNITSGS
jgi:Subtilase family